MTERYDALTARDDKCGKTWWTRIGSAFAATDGFVVVLDAMPASVEGQYKIILRKPRDKNEAGARGRPPAPRRAGDALDDDIPF